MVRQNAGNGVSESIVRLPLKLERQTGSRTRRHCRCRELLLFPALRSRARQYHSKLRPRCQKQKNPRTGLSLHDGAHKTPCAGGIQRRRQWAAAGGRQAFSPPERTIRKPVSLKDFADRKIFCKQKGVMIRWESALRTVRQKRT